MYVVYRKDSLGIDQLVYTAGPEFLNWLATNDDLGFIETPLDKGPHELAVTLVGGEATIIERQTFPFTVPNAATVGVEVRVTGVPTDTAITSDSGSVTMVKSGILDLTFDTAGPYVLNFSHPLYMPLSAVIEVSA